MVLGRRLVRIVERLPVAEVPEHLGGANTIAALLLNAEDLVYLLDLDDRDADRVADRRVLVDPGDLEIFSGEAFISKYMGSFVTRVTDFCAVCVCVCVGQIYNSHFYNTHTNTHKA